MHEEKPVQVYQTYIHNYEISYVSEFAMQQFAENIFANDEHWFTCDVANPYIIDAGANTGCVSLYFKKHFPDAEIVCFEPDTLIYSLLKTNIEKNNLRYVEHHNCALGSFDGETQFFSSNAKHLSGGLGNSIKKSWGIQEDPKLYDISRVPIRRLSPFINKKVDYLKIDVERAEFEILKEIQPKLHLVKQIHLELHCLGSQAVESIEFVKRILERHHFFVTEEKTPLSLPYWTHRWAESSNVSLWTIRAVNLAYFSPNKLLQKDRMLRKSPATI